MAAPLAALLLFALGAQAQNGVFGTVAVGSAAVTQNVTVTAQAPGTVATVEVLTSGANGSDFAAVSGSAACMGATLATSPATTCTQSVAFNPSAPGLRMGAVVLLDSSNDILGTAYLSGVGSGGLGVLVSGNVIPVAGNGKFLDPVVDSIPATSAELYIPSSVTMDGAGNLYIADTFHNRIRMVCGASNTATINGVTCPGAGLILTIAGNDTPGFDGDGGIAANAILSQPSGVALDGAGNLYIADTGNNRIRKIAAATGIITTVAGNGTQGFAGDAAAATAAELSQPQNVALDAAGNLYIVDTDNQRIRRVDAVTGIITTVAGNGTAGFAGDGLAAASPNVELNLPRAVAFDSQGNWYIADSENNRIRQVSASTGIITTLAGTGVAGYSGVGTSAKTAELDAPSGVAVDPAGNVYIGDTQNAAIRKVNSASGLIFTLAKSGTANYFSGGAFYPLNIYGPLGLFLDENANLFFADSLHMTVREMQSNFVAINFTVTPVRQGSESAPTDQTVENDGNAPLNLTLPSILVDTTDPLGFPNAALDPVTTTCLPNTNPLLGITAANEDCVIGAIFAPSLSLNFNGAASMPLDANIYVGTSGDTVNSPLDIELVGVAAALNSTTVVLNGVPNPSTFGQNVVFTATVTTGTGTLTGTVTFYDGPTVLKAGVALSGGVATFSISTLTVGTHSITAVYGGDSSHFSGTSNTWLQVVDEATATSLNSSANPSVLGASVTFTATVTTPNGGGIPLDGTVTFTDTTTGTTLCTPALALIGAAYQSTCATAALTYGPHTITATYGGDAAKYILGSSATMTQDVQAPSTTLLTSNPNPSTFGNTVTFTVTVPTIGTVAATGTVSIFEAGQANPIGTVTLAGNPATGTFTISTLPVSTVAAPDVITASYPGDSYYGPSTSLPVDQIVNQAQTTTTLSAKPIPGIAGAPVVLTATVALVGGTPMTSGTVTFTDTFNGATVTLGTQPLGNAGTATISQLFAPGSHSIVATYSGTTNAATSSATYLLTVNQAATSTVVTATPNPALVDTAVTLTATVTSIGGGTPTGTVTFSANGTQIGSPVTLNASGIATLTDSTLAAASYTITAVYNGDTNDQTSTGSASLVVGKIPTVTSLGLSSTTGPNPQAILVAVVLNNATGSPASLPTPTGTITFTSGTTVIGSATLDTSGVATLTPSLSPGTYNIVAAYGGDTQHDPSSSAAVSVSSTGTGFSLTVTPPTVTMATGQYATVNVALTSLNGFTDTIGLGCASLPSGVTCHFSSPSVSLSAGGVSNVTLTIDTNNPLGGGSSAMNTRSGSRGVSLAGLFLPLGVLFGFAFWRFRKRHPLATTVALLLLLGAGAQFVTGCSGFSQSTATPGTYVIQVTGVGSQSDLSHYQNVSLNITAK